MSSFLGRGRDADERLGLAEELGPAEIRDCSCEVKASVLDDEISRPDFCLFAGLGAPYRGASFADVFLCDIVKRANDDGGVALPRLVWGQVDEGFDGDGCRRSETAAAPPRSRRRRQRAAAGIPHGPGKAPSSHPYQQPGSRIRYSSSFRNAHSPSSLRCRHWYACFCTQNLPLHHPAFNSES